MKHKHCEWCDTQFETKISYQIYCSPICRESSTREKIAQRYVQKRRTKRLGQDRKCKSCGIILSAYNDEEICHECLINPSDVKKALRDLRGLAHGKPE
jgi:hypothetical protein